MNNKVLQGWRDVGKRRESAFIVFQTLIFDSRSFIIMEREGEGRESWATEYQYEFFIWWVLWEIAFQEAGRVKVHGGEEEREWVRGQVIKARSEIMGSLHIKNTDWCFCLQHTIQYSPLYASRAQKQHGTLLLFCLKLQKCPHTFSIFCDLKPPHTFFFYLAPTHSTTHTLPSFLPPHIYF